MANDWFEELRKELLHKREELTSRLDRITAKVRSGVEADSKERAQQLEDSEVVDALGNEARAELKKIAAALLRMDSGDFGFCNECGLEIDRNRMKAYPYALRCIDCATLDERKKSRP